MKVYKLKEEICYKVWQKDAQLAIKSLKKEISHKLWKIWQKEKRGKLSWTMTNYDKREKQICHKLWQFMIEKKGKVEAKKEEVEHK